MAEKGDPVLFVYLLYGKPPAGKNLIPGNQTCLFLLHVADASFGAEAHTGLLYSHPLAQQNLAPSLLLLYGDVEHTGYDPSRANFLFV